MTVYKLQTRNRPGLSPMAACDLTLLDWKGTKTTTQTSLSELARGSRTGQEWACDQTEKHYGPCDKSFSSPQPKLSKLQAVRPPVLWHKLRSRQRMIDSQAANESAQDQEGRMTIRITIIHQRA
mmetsp:Transcript_41722/g.65148  ORF Transcript_41722/g.65148 Transcript_41722/m.65148 type:complete len:124 (-) Transcript_41722:46-417(-)